MNAVLPDTRAVDRRTETVVDHPEPIEARGALPIRLAAFGGAVFFVLMLIQAGFRNGAPSATDSDQEIFDFVSSHAGRLQLGAVLLGLAMSAALLWLCGLFGALRRAEGRTPGLSVAALVGGTLAAASTVMGALIEGTLATRIDDLGPERVGMWWTLWLMSMGATLLGLLLLIGMTTVVALRTSLFPRWFAVTSVLLTLLSLVGAFTIGYAGTGIQVVAGIAVVLDSVWIFLTSVALWRRPSLAS
ncbi:MAG TPA: hypothetical protein VLD86_08800 [Ilumatobacteraceae bacterium]|nr:hypothetical protein [Ilumatobacteraceae bacterium]